MLYINCRVNKKILMVQFLLLVIIVLHHAHATSAFTYRDISLKRYRDSGSSVEFPSGELPHSIPKLFWSKSPRTIFNRRYRCLVLQATSGDKGDNGSGGGGKKGYRFGDITKSLIGGSVEKVRRFEAESS